MANGFVVKGGVQTAGQAPNTRTEFGAGQGRITTIAVTDPKRRILEKVFDAQAERLLDLGYAVAIGMADDDFSAQLAALKAAIDPRLLERSRTGGEMMIVVPGAVVPLRDQMRLFRAGKRIGATGIDAAKIARATPFAPEKLYLAFHFTTGEYYKSMTSEQCWKTVGKKDRRSPTAEEAIAFATHFSSFFGPTDKIELPADLYNGGHLVLMGGAGGAERNRVVLAWTPSRPNEYRDWHTASIGARVFSGAPRAADE